MTYIHSILSRTRNATSAQYGASAAPHGGSKYNKWKTVKGGSISLYLCHDITLDNTPVSLPQSKQNSRAAADDGHGFLIVASAVHQEAGRKRLSRKNSIKSCRPAAHTKKREKYDGRKGSKKNKEGSKGNWVVWNFC